MWPRTMLQIWNLTQMCIRDSMQTLQTWLIMRSAPPAEALPLTAPGSGLPSRSSDGTVTMNPKGNSYSVDNGKDPSNGKKPNVAPSKGDDTSLDDPGQKLKLPKKKKKKKA